MNVPVFIWEINVCLYIYLGNVCLHSYGKCVPVYRWEICAYIIMENMGKISLHTDGKMCALGMCPYITNGKCEKYVPVYIWGEICPYIQMGNDSLHIGVAMYKR